MKLKKYGLVIKYFKLYRIVYNSFLKLCTIIQLSSATTQLQSHRRISESEYIHPLMWYHTLVTRTIVAFFSICGFEDYVHSLRCFNLGINEKCSYLMLVCLAKQFVFRTSAQAAIRFWFTSTATNM